MESLRSFSAAESKVDVELDFSRCAGNGREGHDDHARDHRRAQHWIEVARGELDPQSWVFMANLA